MRQEANALAPAAREVLGLVCGGAINKVFVCFVLFLLPKFETVFQFFSLKTQIGIFTPIYKTY